MTLVLNGTTGVSAVDGSAATPAIQGNDPNTGVFFPAADTVAISTAGVERVQVDSSGNVISTGPSILTRAAATQDGVELAGRAGGTTSLKVTITPTTLTANRSLTLPDSDGTILAASGGTLTVSQGGTGATSQTAYAVICGGTTSTGAYQSIAGVGSAGQVLTSNGAGALPTFQTVSGGVTSFNTRTGAVTLSSTDVTTALGFTPAAQPSSDGIVTRTSAGNYSARTITAGTGISVSNGNGVAGNPTITNSGVTSIVAGTNISISGATGAVTISASSAAPSTAQVLSATAGAGITAVGSYIFGNWNGGAATPPAIGATTAGGNVQYASVGDTGGGTGVIATSSLPGTWRLMGYVSGNTQATVWLRVS